MIVITNRSTGHSSALQPGIRNEEQRRPPALPVSSSTSAEDSPNKALLSNANSAARPAAEPER